MKKFLFETWYGPVVAWSVAAGLLLGYGALDTVLQYRMPHVLGSCIGWAFFIPFVVATLFNIAVFLFALTDKQWKRALLQLLAGVVALAGFVFALLWLAFFSMLGPSDDHFADNLTIPPEVMADLVVPVSATAEAVAVQGGTEEFVLRDGMQPGIYNLTLRINPGEPGVTYLKAYEVTKGTRLSADRLAERSNARVGWSDDPAEKFLYENEFTIYEGDWDTPYAARIEVWFRPDSGKGERKLMERVCKIEGWQR